MYKLYFYVPESHLEVVKEAIFAKGAGNIGNYAKCCWQVIGEGQFMPLENSQAFLGQPGIVEKVAEYKVEVVVKDDLIADVILALKQAHPYETPAYGYWKVAGEQ